MFPMDGPQLAISIPVRRVIQARVGLRPVPSNIKGFFAHLSHKVAGAPVVLPQSQCPSKDVAIFTISRAAWGSPQTTTDEYASP